MAAPSPSIAVSPVKSPSEKASPAPPTNDEIEAVIQAATAGCTSPGPIPGKDTRTQLFVGNLPYRVRWQDLKDLFRKSGTVLRADVSLSPDNRSRGYGTVLLATAEDAGRAIDMYNGYVWQNRTLEVRLDRLPIDFDASNPPPVPAFKPAPSPLPMSASPFDQSFSSKLSSSSGSVTGFSLSLQDERSDKLSPLSGLERPRSSTSMGPKSVFVGNLPFHCQWQDLKDIFRQAGTVIRADVTLGPDGRSRGFGTVTFATEVDADKAVTMFNGFEFNGRKLKVHHDKFSSTNPPNWMPTSGSQPQMSTSTPSPFLNLPYDSSSFSGFASGPASPFGAPIGMFPPSQFAPPMGTQHIGPERAPSPFSSIPPTLRTEGEDTAAQTTSPHPAHPGPIALPTPTPVGFSFPSGHPISPGHHPLTPIGVIPMTPLGLPPMTPSMPAFSFAPQAMTPTGGVPTPPINAAMMSPPMAMSPGMFSPGAFWGRPGAMGNPFINAAVGAPVMMHPGGMPASPGTPQFFGMAAQQGDNERREDPSYFPSAPPQEVGYFPAVPPLQLRSSLAYEIKHLDNEELEDDKRQSPAFSGPSDNDTDLGLREGDTRSSVATSISDADEAAKCLEDLALEDHSSRHFIETSDARPTRTRSDENWKSGLGIELDSR